MSTLYESASFYLGPGYKASKVYAVVPDDGDGDMTFTRATAANRINQSGLLELLSTNVPALDFAAGTCPGFRIEGPCTNLALRSEELTNAAWVAVEDSVGEVLVSTSLANSPRDSGSAFDISFTAAKNYLALKQNVTLASSTQYTLSIWAAGSFRLAYDDDAGNITYSPVLTGTSAGSGDPLTSRLSFTFTTPSSPGANQNIRIANTTPGAVNGIFVWGAQVELGPAATSYIRSEGTAGVRNASSYTLTNLQSKGILSAAGTMYINGTLNTENGNGNLIALRAAASPNNNRLYIVNRGFGSVVSSGSAQLVSNILTLTTFTGKVAISWNPGGCLVSVGGSTVSATGIATTAGNVLDSLEFVALTTPQRSSYIKELALWPRQLNQTELNQLTAS